MGLELGLQEGFSPGERRDLEGKRSKAGKGIERGRVWGPHIGEEEKVCLA